MINHAVTDKLQSITIICTNMISVSDKGHRVCIPWEAERGLHVYVWGGYHPRPFISPFHPRHLLLCSLVLFLVLYVLGVSVIKYLDIRPRHFIHVKYQNYEADLPIFTSTNLVLVLKSGHVLWKRGNGSLVSVIRPKGWSCSFVLLPHCICIYRSFPLKVPNTRIKNCGCILHSAKCRNIRFCLNNDLSKLL